MGQRSLPWLPLSHNMLQPGCGRALRFCIPGSGSLRKMKPNMCKTFLFKLYSCGHHSESTKKIVTTNHTICFDSRLLFLDLDAYLVLCFAREETKMFLRSFKSPSSLPAWVPSPVGGVCRGMCLSSFKILGYDMSPSITYFLLFLDIHLQRLFSTPWQQTLVCLSTFLEILSQHRPFDCLCLIPSSFVGWLKFGCVVTCCDHESPAMSLYIIVLSSLIFTGLYRGHSQVMSSARARPLSI